MQKFAIPVFIFVCLIVPANWALAAKAGPPHGNGVIFQDGKTVFLVDKGLRRPFASAEEYLSYGWKFGNITPVTTGDQALPQGPIMKAQGGTLALDRRDQRTVYMIGSNGSARPFDSLEVFSGLGFSLKNIRPINMGAYGEMSPINSLTEHHPEGSLVLDKGTVYWISTNKLPFSSDFDFWRYGFIFDQVVPANEADMALPQGPIVPDPTVQWGR